MNELENTLADRINAARQAACVQAAGAALEHAMRCGDLLAEAKAACNHGEWQDWMARHFSGSARLAQSYMNLASNREMIESKSAESAHLSIDGAMKLIAIQKPTGVPDLNEAIAHYLEIKGVHELAHRYPLPNEKEHAMMVNSIRHDGLIHPVTVTTEGLLIDGKWRVLACYDAQAELEYETTTSDPVDVVQSANDYRAHYTEDELAMAAAQVEEIAARA